MNKEEKIISVLKLIALIFSYMMVALVAFNYGYMYYANKFDGVDASPNISFIFAFPFIIVIFICFIISKILKKKIDKK